MRKYRNLVILAGILVLLILAYVFVPKLIKEDESDTGNNYESITVLNLKKDELEQITLKGADETLTFKWTEIEEEVEVQKEDGTTGTEKKKKNVWMPVSPSGWNVDTSKVDSVVYNAISITADKLIEEAPQDLSIYGLDKPQRTVTLKMTDGSETVVYVGNMTPTKGAYYLKTTDSDTVYTVGTYSGDKLLSKKLSLMKLALFEAEAADITDLKMIRNGETVFVGRRVDEYSWELSEPIISGASGDNISKILEPLATISATEFVEEDAKDLAQYGLLNPRYVFEYTVNDQGMTLKLGKVLTEKNSFYALVGESKDVITLPVTNFQFVDKPIEEIVDPFIHIPNIVDLSKLEVHIDGRVDVALIDSSVDNKEDDKFVFNGKDISADEDAVSAFRKYYQGVIGITVNLVEPKAEPTAQPEVSFYFTTKADGKVTRVDLVPRDQYTYYGVKDGVYTGLVVNKSTLDKRDDSFPGFRHAYERLTNAIQEME